MDKNFSIANSEFRLGNYYKAIKHYKNCVASIFEFSWYHLNIYKCYKKMGLHAEAEVALVQSILLGNETALLERKLFDENEAEINANEVLVVIPAFNAERTIKESVESVLDQENVSVRVVIVNDCSSDSTLKVISKLASFHNNVYILHLNKNVGSYNAINAGLFACRRFGFAYFCIHGADDLMVGNKLYRQVKNLNTHNYHACIAGYRRLEFGTKKIIKSAKRGDSMIVFKRDVFNRIGYYDNTRFGGDSEYKSRMLMEFGDNAMCSLPELLTDAYFDNKNITFNNPDNSKKRFRYVDIYNSRHLDMSKISTFYKGFALSELNIVKFLKAKSPVICGMATVENRKSACIDAIYSLIDQVDCLVLYQNGFKDIEGPFNHHKILIYSSIDTGIDMGDAGKFYKVSSFNDAYYFSVDDDLIYPPDYVSTLINYLRKYDHRFIVSCHGRNLKPDAQSYYNDFSSTYRCLGEVPDEAFVQFGGTGVMAFHTSNFYFDFKHCKYPNMADIWVGIHAKYNKIPILIVPHKKGWILHSNKFDIETTIYSTHRGKLDSFQNNIISNLNLYHIASGVIYRPNLIDNSCCKTKISVAIPTFNRNSMLTQLLEDIDLNADGYMVSVDIFNDGGDLPHILDTSYYKNINVINVHHFHNHGKKNYWKLVNFILDVLSQRDSEYYFYIPDDVRMKSCFFNSALDTFNSIQSDFIISLNLLNDGRDECWTKFKRELKTFDGVTVYKSQWLDMAIMFTAKFLRYRVESIAETRWSNNPNISSGVGEFFSRHFHSLGFEMFQVQESLLSHGNHESKMNYAERITNPLIA